MNATLTETDPGGTSGSDVLPWLAFGWAVVSELLPLLSNDRVQANGVLHGIQCALQSECVRQLFTKRNGGPGSGQADTDLPL